MARPSEPIVLELAALPREQAGPFLLLGLDKTADREAIESHWAERVKWARKGLLKVPLEDVNWAREQLSENDRRVRADAGSLNIDLADAVLGSLAYRYGISSSSGRRWKPLERSRAATRTDALEIPDPIALASSITLPAVPEELPALAMLLDAFARAPLDPWSLPIPASDEDAAP